MNYCKYPFENDKNGLEPDICGSGNWENPPTKCHTVNIIGAFT